MFRSHDCRSAFGLCCRGEAFAQALTPRAPIQKRPIDQVVATPGAVTGEIVVKFHDEALARLDASGNLSFNGPARGGRVPNNCWKGSFTTPAIKATLKKCTA